MLTKGAIGNLVNRYKAVLAKCNLINTFGSLAVASMLVLGGAGVVSADAPTEKGWFIKGTHPQYEFSKDETLTFDKGVYVPVGYEGNEVPPVDEYRKHSLISSGGDSWTIQKECTLKIIDPTDSGTLKLMSSNKEPNDRTGLLGIFLQGGTHSIQVNTLDINTINNCYQTQTVNEGPTSFTIQSNSVTMTSKELNVIQVYDGETIINANTITLNAGNNALRTTNDGEVVITAKERLEITGADNAIKAGGTSEATVTGGKNSSLTGNISVLDSGTVSITLGEGSIVNGQAVVESGATLTLDGDVTFSGNTADDVANDIQNNGTLTINGNVALDGGITGTGTLDGDGTVLFSSTKTTVEQDSVADTLTAKASGDVNDQLSGDTSSFEKMGFKNVQMEEGLISGEVSKNADGSVVKKVNTVLADTLEQATAAPLAVNRILMNDVRKRMGDLRADKNESGVWMRWDGGKLKGDEGLTNNFNTIQIGGDTKVAKNCRFGVAGSFTHGDVDHSNGGGELESYTFAAYGTWMAENGMFADVIARVGFTNSEIQAKGGTADIDNEALSLSAEYGWRLPVCDQFFLEPQVELTYTHVTGADFTIKTAKYDIDSVDSLIGRAGLVAGWNLPNDMGNVYARASVVHEFLGDAKISATNNGGYAAHELDGNDTWLEYGIGANVKLTDSTYLWADVERTEGADIEEEWRGTVGVRFSF